PRHRGRRRAHPVLPHHLRRLRHPTYSSCANAGSACSKTVGNGAQTGLATVDTADDDVLSISGNGPHGGVGQIVDISVV
ncbi:MAG: hypothetical protein ACRDPR_08420, partial [Nocardioidaceae bacterium]